MSSYLLNRTKSSPFGWREFNYQTLENIPRRPGVYVIYYENRIYYIGSSTNMRARLKIHQCKMLRRRFQDLSLIRVKVRMAVRYGEWLMNEARLIRKLKPQFNSLRGFVQ